MIIGGIRGLIGGYGVIMVCRCFYLMEGCFLIFMWFFILILFLRIYYRKKSIVVVGDMLYI